MTFDVDVDASNKRFKNRLKESKRNVLHPTSIFSFLASPITRENNHEKTFNALKNFVIPFMPSLNGGICRYEHGSASNVGLELNEDECLFLFFSHVLMNSSDVKNSASFKAVKQMVDTSTCLQTIALAGVETFYPTPYLLENLKHVSGEERFLSLTMHEGLDLYLKKTQLHDLLVPKCIDEQLQFAKIEDAGRILFLYTSGEGENSIFLFLFQ